MWNSDGVRKSEIRAESGKNSFSIRIVLVFFCRRLNSLAILFFFVSHNLRTCMRSSSMSNGLELLLTGLSKCCFKLRDIDLSERISTVTLHNTTVFSVFFFVVYQQHVASSLSFLNAIRFDGNDELEIQTRKYLWTDIVDHCIANDQSNQQMTNHFI